jgi:hypothetical protein
MFAQAGPSVIRQVYKVIRSCEQQDLGLCQIVNALIEPVLRSERITAFSAVTK